MGLDNKAVRFFPSHFSSKIILPWEIICFYNAQFCRVGEHVVIASFGY